MDELCPSDASGPRAKLPSTPLSIVYQRVADLKPDPKNPRTHSPQQIRKLGRNISKLGFNVPLLVDKDNRVIAGHGRLLACKQLGITEVPTISLAHLTPEQAKALQIADNRLCELGTWDDKLLGDTLKELSFLELELDIELTELTGFDAPEIDFRIQSLEAEATEQEDPADQVSLTSGPPVSKPGDVWVLDRHRLVCGSALEGSTYDLLLSGEKADVVFTDPPYNVPIKNHVCGSGAVQHREFAMASGEMTKPEFTAFLRTTCSLLAAHSVLGSVHFLCMDWRHMGELLAAGEDAYDELLNICVWVKRNGGMGTLYRSQHELVLVFRNGDVQHCNNVQLGRFGRNRSNVWQYAGANDFGRVTEEGNLLAMHPTVKPVALVADALLDCSARGHLVLDPFLGSGTTLIAAERTGRSCRGIELDSLYVDTAIRRWQKLTGGTAIHALTGRSFENHAKDIAK